jgi:hypothetical protein
MMIHEAKLGSGIGERLAKAIFASALMPHAQKEARGIQDGVEVGRLPAGGVIFEVMQKRSSRRRPTLAYEIDSGGLNSREIQAGLNRQRWKTGIVLDPAQTFFGDGKQYLTIARDTRR